MYCAGLCKLSLRFNFETKLDERDIYANKILGDVVGVIWENRTCVTKKERFATLHLMGDLSKELYTIAWKSH